MKKVKYYIIIALIIMCLPLMQNVEADGNVTQAKFYSYHDGNTGVIDSVVIWRRKICDLHPEFKNVGTDLKSDGSHVSKVTMFYRGEKIENYSNINIKDVDFVFCVEPFIQMWPGVTYDMEYTGDGIWEELSKNLINPYDSGLSDENSWERIKLLAYYGSQWFMNDDSSAATSLRNKYSIKEWYAAAQCLIWRAAHPDIQTELYNDEECTGIYNNAQELYNKLNELVSKHNVMPSFQINESLVVGKEYTFNDVNNVLESCKIKSTSNCNVRIDGNTIHITPLNDGEITINFIKGDSDASESKNKLYYKKDYMRDAVVDKNEQCGQNLIYIGSASAESSIKAQAAGLSIRILKRDSETGEVAQGDASLEGAVYGVYNSIGSQVATLTIHNGEAKTGYLPLGTYSIREITAPTGYKLSNSSYSVTLSNKDEDVYVYDDVIKGSLEILKTAGATDYDKVSPLAGAQFKVTLVKDPTKVYYTNVSENDGICRVNNLPYGEYIVEEYVVPPSGLKVADFNITISQDGEVKKLDIEDKTKKMKIKIIKKDAEKLESDAPDYSIGDATLKGAEYTIYRENNGGILSDEVATIVVDHKDENGYWCAESGYMLVRPYYVKETKAPEGYLINNTIYELNENAQTQEVELSTKEKESLENVIRGNLKIYKTLEESDYDEKIPLLGAQFTVKLKSAIGTSEEERYTFKTNISGEDGICELNNLPYGTYVVEETTVPDSALKVNNFEFSVIENNETYMRGTKNGTIQECEDGEDLIDISKKMKIVIRKQDYDADIYGKNKAGSYGWTQGDATFKGAQYTIYRKYENGVLSDVVDTITVDHQNKARYWCAESNYMWTGTYYVKETKRPEGYLIDENVYTFSQDPATQVEEKITIERALENGGRSTEKVERGRVEVVKFDQNTDTDEKVPATGAKLWLVLNSTVPGGVDGKSSSEIAKLSGLTYYEEIVDEDGYVDFVDKIYRAQYPDDEYTIPYGTYTIIEIAGSEEGAKTHFFNKPQEVKVTRQSENKYYILGEEQVRMYLQIQKTDKDSDEDVQIGGAKYMVWDVARDKFVEQKFTPDGDLVSVFETNSNGMITLPEKLDAGDYIVYEIEAPEGYYLDEEYKLPANESDYGKIEKGGALFTIDKEALKVKPDSTGEEVDLYYKAEIANTPLKGILKVVKTGEQFSGTTQVTQKYEKSYEVTKPKFENKGLKDVTYEIYAAEDIKSKDGRYTYVTAGTKVDTITTNSDGIAETEELYCGEYRIVETVTPKGYITDNNIPNVVLENEGPEEVKTTVKELNNVRQKLSVMIDKVFEDVKYSSSQEVKKEAVFGIYANQDFTYSNGNLAIKKDKLVATAKVIDGVAQDTDSIDLPEGEYYVKELEASYPYTILDETKNVTLKYEGQEEKLTFGAGRFENKTEGATVTLIKLSTSTLEDVVLSGSEIDTSKLDEEVQALLKELSGKSTEEVKTYLKEKQVKFVAGAKYGVYIDENCTEPLYMEDEDGRFVVAVMETDDSGLISMGEVPLGTYYFKEIEAPKGYELSKDVVKLELTLENKDAVVYQALIEEPVLGRGIIKTDAFTGDYVDNCEFELRDVETDEVIVHSTTGTYKEDKLLREQGQGYIPLDKIVEGRTYTFTELSAPNIYDLNTEPHEFTAHFDENGNWDVEPIEVENTRKKSEVTFEKSDFADSTPIPNCKFELRSLETDFVVEGVTDEEGKYVFKDIPYGKYTYRELEAPEEYMIDTEEHEIVIDTEETTVKITNEKAPDTSDIAVYTLSVVALVSILGIVYAIKRNKKMSE